MKPYKCAICNREIKNPESKYIDTYYKIIGDILRQSHVHKRCMQKSRRINIDESKI
jgi:hypothetical protein